MANYKSFLQSLGGILSREQLNNTLRQFSQTLKETLETMWKHKMGTNDY